jgi:DNA-binding NarL/FixJ family response regulator
MAAMTIRVLMAEDNALLRQGMASLLERVDDIDVVVQCGDLAELQAAAAEHKPDVVVTDIRMPPGQSDEGIQAALWLGDEHPGIGVVVLSQYVNPDYAVRLLGAGAAGRAYLLKERVGDVDELARAIREVASGGSVVDPAVVHALVEASRARPISPVDRLTPRETEVLAEMAQGKSNAAIAAHLVLSERAVEKHSNSIFMKFGLSEEKDRNRRVSAVLIYLERGGGENTTAARE